MVSTHSRLKAAGIAKVELRAEKNVSTHSRLKAAGWCAGIKSGAFQCFNTQPPEGGWLGYQETGLVEKGVSTHSRLKAAGCGQDGHDGFLSCFNTQPPEGGWAFLRSF